LLAVLRVAINACFSRFGFGGIGATASSALLVPAVPAIGPLPHIANHVD
jgi:hypothetical protein